MVARRKIIKTLILLVSLVALTLGGRVLADVQVNMEVCTDTNAEPVFGSNFTNGATVFDASTVINFQTDWVYTLTTSRGAIQLASSNVAFAANQSFSQTLALVSGANNLQFAINGGCPRHDVSRNLVLNYVPNGISINPLTTSVSSPALTGKVGKNNHKIKVTVNGKTYNATNNGDGSWTLPVGTINPALVDGVYDVSLQLLDNATNAVLNTVNEVGAVTINGSAPVIQITKLVTNKPSPALTGAINSPTHNVQVEINGQTYNATNNGDGSWTLPAGTIVPDLVDGDYDVTVRALDSITNAVAATATLAPGLTVDATAPVVTVNTATTTERQPEITGTVNDSTAKITVEINGQTYTAVNNGDGTWTLPAGTISPLASGDYDMTVTATDAAGNSHSVKVVFKVSAKDDLGFFLPPATGYFRIHRTNIPSWLVYLAIVGLGVGAWRLTKKSKPSVQSS